MSQPIQDSRTAWGRLGVTVLAGTIGNVGMWSVIVALPMMAKDFGLERAESSALFAATMIGFAIGNVVTGRMLDRHGLVPTLLLAGLLTGLGHIVTGFAPNPWVAGVAQVAVGLGTAGCFSPLMADISHWFRRRRGIAVSIAASANYLAGIVWPLLLNLWIPVIGWGRAYALTGLLVLVLLPGLIRILRHPLPAEARDSEVAAAGGRSLQIRQKTYLLMLSLAGVACCVAMSMPQVHIVALCMDLGFGPAVGAEMLSLMLAGGVVSRLIGGVISDRIGGLATLLLFGTMQMLALFLYLPFDGLISLYIVSLIFGLSQGGIVPAYAVIVREYMPASVAGANVGIVMMATILGMAFGGWLSGAIHDWTGSYAAAFLNGIVWNAANVGIVLWLLSRGGRLQFTHRSGKAAASA